MYIYIYSKNLHSLIEQMPVFRDKEEKRQVIVTSH